MRAPELGAATRSDPTPDLLRHCYRLRRVVVLAEGIPQPVIEIRNGLTQVPLGPTGPKESCSFQPVSDTPGQVLRNAASHEFALEQRKESNQRRHVRNVTASHG